MQIRALRLDDIRLDRAVIRVVVAASFTASLLSATGVTSNRHPGPAAIAVGSAAGILTVLAFLVGGSWWLPEAAGAERTRWRAGQLWALSLGAAAVAVALPYDSLSWMPFLPIMIAARACDLPQALGYAAAPAAGLVWLQARHPNPLSGVLLSLAIAAAIIAILQQRRRQVEAAELYAAQQQVIVQERARSATAEGQREIAAQLHDVLAHTLSGLVVSVQTAELQARQEGASIELQQRLSAAADLAKDGLRGARQAVEALQGAANRAEATPLAEWLAQTVDRLHTASDADISVEGDACVIPADRQETARAVLREGITNSLRHAPGLPVRISLTAREIRVLTAGDPTDLPQTDQVSGRHGLAGLRRRVQAQGGRFEAGATAAGWLVIARWEDG
ncbi:sensor histidine kinase [Flexivirga caeni]|uniref:Signal transduction histidine kinase subgroup 3 dimerisation and phosphoacceptor domain-containing protein n=1 Tax=Flexivirga caeni TaxID=2294115 RepID=A0A3M9MIV5_9MICO|nr:histidine kinase [Flexivirga caeni]RNI25434.1 hypothetical protein EFY87_02095 [Flexivirga caeni]